MCAAAFNLLIFGVLALIGLLLVTPSLLWPRSYEEYVILYRERRQIALSMPGEPYDFGHDPLRLLRILREVQTDPLLERARRLVLGDLRRRAMIAPGIAGAIAVVMLVAVVVR
jgi:hypothetical protein